MTNANPDRYEAIRSLASKKPMILGKRGSADLWAWLGRKYLMPEGRDFIERNEAAFLPDLAFDLLSRYVCEHEVYRGYASEADAMADLALVRRRLEDGR